MRPDALKRYAGPVPRYTSYPTAPNFSASVNASVYGAWLSAIPASSTLSLYVHIPYCTELCWYCGCSTTATQKYEPVARYLDVLITEIEAVARRVPAGLAVKHIHWGGGSPNILSAKDIARLADAIRQQFRIADDAEFAVEVDPRTAPDDRVRAFASAGVNRVSVGVQDFAEPVQQAINRMQSFDMTEQVVASFRASGIRALNIDLVYGLPRQTRDSIRDTVKKVLQLRPERIALFGYAHLPSRLKHQRLIDDADLPDTTERFAQSNRAASLFLDAGYRRIGLDHFVLPEDRLAQQGVRRNFQGYTDDSAPVLIGMGASAIGRLPQGYVQNTANVRDYAALVAAGGLATARGHQLSTEDAARSFAIERLMCDLRFPARELRETFGDVAEPVIEEATALLDMEHDGLIEPDPEHDIFRVTEKGRLFVRSICSVFDRYLDAGPSVGSQGV